LQFYENSIADYQQVTGFVEIRDFGHGFTFAEFYRKDVEVVEINMSQKRPKWRQSVSRYCLRQNHNHKPVVWYKLPLACISHCFV